MPIIEGSSYNVYVPSTSFFTNKILNQEYFSYAKLSVEWWMLIIKAMPIIRMKVSDIIKNGLDKKSIPALAKGMCEAWDRGQKCGRKYKSNAAAIERVLEMSITKKPDGFLLGVTDRCNLKSLTFPLPFRGHNIIRLIEGMLPKDEIPVHALPFRIWAANGEINNFIDQIRHKTIVLVGPSHLKNFGYKMNLKNFHYVEIHSSDAILHIHKTKAQIQKLHKKLLSKNDDVLYFFIGGGAAMWLITELHGLEKAYIIDIGRAFDVYYFYDPVMKKYPGWMFGQWLNRRNTAWVQNKLAPDKNGTYCVK